jgi:hypothetical protein
MPAGGTQLQSPAAMVEASQSPNRLLRAQGNPTFTMERAASDEPANSRGLVARFGGQAIELSPLAEAKAEAQPTALAAKLKRAVEPGMRWQGTMQAPGEASQAVKLTFSALRDQGSYARAVIEPADDPRNVRIFEGAVALAESEVLGWPINLRPELRLTVQADGTLIGWHGRQRIHCPTSQPIEGWRDPAVLVRETVAPGRRYAGTVQREGRAAEEIAITFAERRGDGEYIRAIVERTQDGLAAATYEGAIKLEDDAVSGFAIGLVMKARGYGEPALFNGWPDQLTLSLRPLPDGISLYGFDNAGDRLKLALVADAKLPPLDTISFAQLLREKCGAGKVWVGKLKNATVQEAADVHLTFGPQNDDSSFISATISVQKARGPKVGYEGVLHVDDARVNQFAIELTKKTKGPIAQSTIFNGWTDTKLVLRMSLDGTMIYGHADNERLELRERNLRRAPTRRPATEDAPKPPTDE